MPVQIQSRQATSARGQTYYTSVEVWYPDSSVKQAKSLVSDDQLRREIRNYKARARHARQDRCPSQIPSTDWLKHALLTEAQAPDFTVNDDGEFSSRDLTDRYVAEYCRLNHLKA